jgi:hypothetical protein
MPNSASERSYAHVMRRSLFCVAIGLIVETLAFNLRIFYEPITHPGIILYATLNWTSAIAVRTGFGLVLLSRLHIVRQDRWLQRGLLLMIIVAAFVGHIGTIILSIAGYVQNFSLLQRIYNIWVYIDVVFTLQDIIISSLYIFYFWQYMNDVPAHAKEQMKTETRTMFVLLVLAYVWVIMADVSMYALLCSKLYLARMMCLPVLEALKLQVEFFVLNRLVEVSKLKQQLMGRQSIGSSLFGPVASTGTVDVEANRAGRPLERGSSSGMSNVATLAEIPSGDPEKKV